MVDARMVRDLCLTAAEHLDGPDARARLAELYDYGDKCRDAGFRLGLFLGLVGGGLATLLLCAIAEAAHG